MKKQFRILTINGSPMGLKSNTQTMVNDIVEEMKFNGLDADHKVVSLGRKNVLPCKGCWLCTKGKPCPIKDDLEEIKKRHVGLRHAYTSFACLYKPNHWANEMFL